MTTTYPDARIAAQPNDRPGLRRPEAPDGAGDSPCTSAVGIPFRGRNPYEPEPQLIRPLDGRVGYRDVTGYEAVKNVMDRDQARAS